jgi:NAD+ diphosphatase
MMGCIALAEEETIFLRHDPELAEAKWFTKEEVKVALRENAGNLSGTVPPGKEKGLRLPAATAIAHVLLKRVVDDAWVVGA